MNPLPFLLGFVIMSLGSLAIYAKGNKQPAHGAHTFVHSAVPFIAATAYLAMAFGVGDILKIDGTITYTARYADWSITTPLLLAGLVMTAMQMRGRAWGIMTAIIVLDVLMIVTGLIASLAILPSIKLVWFLWSCAAFVGVLYLLWVPLRAASRAEGSALDRAYAKNLTFLTVIWILYPVVFAAGPEGLYVISGAATTWAILVLDVIAKVVYGFTAGSNVEQAEAELATRDGRRA